ncbi:MAG: hypothetical protein Q7S58_02055 [Candidatus Binatus sp.]|uniref:hypothetical protein n=1 Tax=Candidatus Binatus sp. TaxID=2811406 RepID=UPI00271ADCC7|nr:hypothetical protein [Candidatus Binatus sp.]MDO8431173.1 hypothetical protein [Candidatus Binatus sp.]
MLPAKRLLDEVISSLRTVIAPAIAEPYPKSQAFMAAVILEFLSQQVTERSDIATAKHAALESVFADLAKLFDSSDAANVDGDNPEARLCNAIERLYARREMLGEEIFTSANRRIRQALRELLDQDLKIAAPKKG